MNSSLSFAAAAALSLVAIPSFAQSASIDPLPSAAPHTADTAAPPTVHLGELNKLDGTAISNVEVPDVEALGISPGGIAFAHWGGHFWFFVSKDFGPTQVYDHDPVANTTVLAKSDGPNGVVVAGVSTCAPLEIPK